MDRKNRVGIAINAALCVLLVTLAATLARPQSFHALADTVADWLKGGVFASATVPLTATTGHVIVADGTSYKDCALSGDGTIASGGAITITKTNGVSFAPSATTDATNANNITTGTLGIGVGGTGLTAVGVDGTFARANLGAILWEFPSHYSTQSNDYFVVQADNLGGTEMDCTAGTFIVTLPSVGTVGGGFTVTVVKADSSTNPLMILPNASDGIDGAARVTKTITFSQVATNVATITTSAAHSYVVGEVVQVSPGVNTFMGGKFVIATVPSTTTFTYALTHANIGPTGETGTTVGAVQTISQQHGKITYMSTGVNGTGAKQGWTVISSAGDYVTSGATGLITISSNATGAMTQITLHPGDWDISGLIEFNQNGCTTSSAVQWFGSIATTNVGSGTLGDTELPAQQPTANYDTFVSIPAVRVSVTIPTQYFLNAGTQAITVGAPKGLGRISARRIR